MNTRHDPVDDILVAHGLNGPWETLPQTGLANRIYATKDVVLRIAKDHDEALRDARTESLAAPIAFDAGVLTPQLLAFDDSGDLIDGPYSIWERIHGETLGLLTRQSDAMANTWRQVGSQMAHLHSSVQPFDDPEKRLHTPARELDLDRLLEGLAQTGFASSSHIDDIAELIAELRPAVLADFSVSFLHADVKDMNIMCTSDDELLALIDWGDSGWGDPAFDFFRIPLPVIPIVLEGYRDVAPSLLDATSAERMIWDKLEQAMSRAIETPAYHVPIDAFRRYLGTR